MSVPNAALQCLPRHPPLASHSDAPASACKRRRRSRNCARGLSGRVRRCRGCRSAAGRLGQGRLRFFQFRGVVFITVGPHTALVLSLAHTRVSAAHQLTLSLYLYLYLSLFLSLSLTHTCRTCSTSGSPSLTAPRARSSIAGLHFLTATARVGRLHQAFGGPHRALSHSSGHSTHPRSQQGSVRCISAPFVLDAKTTDGLRVASRTRGGKRR